MKPSILATSDIRRSVTPVRPLSTLGEKNTGTHKGHWVVFGKTNKKKGGKKQYSVHKYLQLELECKKKNNCESKYLLL